MPRFSLRRGRRLRLSSIGSAVLWSPGDRIGKGRSVGNCRRQLWSSSHPGKPRRIRDYGIFFPEQSADSLAEAILAFESCEETFEPKHIRLHARRFDTSIFINRMHNYISSVMVEHRRHHSI